VVITIPSSPGLGIYAAVEDEVSTNPSTVGCCEAASRMPTVALMAFGMATLGSEFIDKSAAYNTSVPDPRYLVCLQGLYARRG